MRNEQIDFKELLGEDLAREYDPKRPCNFSHVVTTLAATARLSLDLAEDPQEWQQEFDYMEKYAALVRDFPELKEQEMMEREEQEVKGDTREYIDGLEKKFRGN
jgi:hypothetical protein